MRGAVGIAQDTVKELSRMGVAMSPHQQFEIVSNILIVSCGKGEGHV